MPLAARLAVEAFAEAVADAVLAGGVVGAGDAHGVEHLLALGELVEGDRDGARGAAGHQHGLVLADEAGNVLHRLVGLGAVIGDAVLQLPCRARPWSSWARSP